MWPFSKKKPPPDEALPKVSTTREVERERAWASTLYHPSLTDYETDKSIYIYSPTQRKNFHTLVNNSPTADKGYAFFVGVLVPEPKNKYDPQAVQVVIAGKPIGYLTTGSQLTAREIMKAQRPEEVLVRVCLMPANERLENDLAVYFRSPKDEEEWLARKIRNYNLRTYANVREAAGHQPQLQQIHDSGNNVRPCELRVDEQPSGKYKGGPRITIIVDDIGKVGVIAAMYQERDKEFFDRVLAGQRTGEVAAYETIEEGDVKRYWARVYLE